ncbi:YceI family protein [Hyunsoonleella sp. SJ7]|uniref:YceI family protein n=1 Tax=Hyunsoonleella aquatilis TaxID=2762758 RepID=A0A923KJQ7_9FLAO|nr:YceI family protein [Hyunsoonleella aquatilis]MBC3757672.1 YceI family protein [Hyunsoonleella aquatilis]
MKYIIVLVGLISVNVFAQSKYFTKTGTVEFEASVPSFEEVKAKNTAVTAILNTDNGEFAALVLVKGFRFKNALMEEHFNENYAESDEYPKATFKGKIYDFSMKKLRETGELKIDGELTFHGVTKRFNGIPINLLNKEGTILLKGNFVALASDFDIKIPKIVSNKIAEDIEIIFTFNMKKK